MKTKWPSPAFADKSDAELAADYRMIQAESRRHSDELEARGYDVGVVLYFEKGRIEVEINRIEKNAL